MYYWEYNSEANRRQRMPARTQMINPSGWSDGLYSEVRMKPKHFDTYKRFSAYILHLALNDRREYLASIEPSQLFEPDEEDAETYRETEAEIAAIKSRLKKISV